MTLPKTFRGRDVNADYERVMGKSTTSANTAKPIIKQTQIADVSSKEHILLPQEFTGKDYILEVAPARLANSPAVKKVGITLNINYQSTRIDSLNRKFVGNNNWHNSLKLNLALGGKTLDPREFIGLANLLFQGMNDRTKVYDVSGKRIYKQTCQKYFEDIFKVQDPRRAEWIDANYKFKQGKIYAESNHIVDLNGNLISQHPQLLDKKTLVEYKGILLEDYIQNPTSQGLPKQDVESGDFHYYAPMENNDSFARSDTNSDRSKFYANWNVSFSDSYLGTRFAKKIK